MSTRSGSRSFHVNLISFAQQCRRAGREASGVSSLIIIIFSSVLRFGCASVPAESVTLSEDLTGMIRAAQSAHLALVDQYIAERKSRAADFLDRKWIPIFMQNAVNDTKILAKLQSERDPQKQSALLAEFSGDAADQITKRRGSMFDAIDEVGRSLRDAVSAHYADMLTANQALTAHLRSAADVTETRDQLLASLNVNPKTIVPIDQLNQVMEKILGFTGNGDELIKYVDQAKAIIHGR